MSVHDGLVSGLLHSANHACMCGRPIKPGTSTVPAAANPCIFIYPSIVHA
jgi:hypothetical protein